MTILETAPVAQPAPSSGGDDIVHEVCCVDDDLTICGQKAEGMQWNQDAAAATCVMCAALLERIETLDVCAPPPSNRSEPPCGICPRKHLEGRR